jgi:hypothetical protein
MPCIICGNLIDELRHPISGEVVWDQGHNAEPVKDGRCCSHCNNTVVLPQRLIESKAAYAHTN